MKALSILRQYLVILALLLPLSSMGQQLQGGVATPAASSLKAGNLQYTFRIGFIGNAKVERIAQEKEAAATGSATKNDIEPAAMAAKAFPNPCTNFVKIAFATKEEPGKPIIQIIDHTGRLMEASFQYQQTDKRRGLAIVDTTPLPQGQYIIRIITGGCIYAVNAIKI